MDALTDWLIGFVSAADNPAGLAVLAGSAMVEYVFPPFPGDTITLLGAVLITAYGWSFAGVFGAVMLGSMAGAMIDFYLGQRIERARARRRQRRAEAGKSRLLHRSGDDPVERRAILDGLVEKFARHGAVYLVLNRFVPGIRALFFVAAGMAGMKPFPVLAYATLSAALWNLALIAVGGLIGANLDDLLHLVRSYNLVVIGLIATVAAGLLVRALVRARRRGL